MFLLGTRSNLLKSFSTTFVGKPRPTMSLSWVRMDPPPPTTSRSIRWKLWRNSQASGRNGGHCWLLWLSSLGGCNWGHRLQGPKVGWTTKKKGGGRLPCWELTYTYPKALLKMFFFPMVGYVSSGKVVCFCVLGKGAPCGSGCDVSACFCLAPAIQ